MYYCFLKEDLENLAKDDPLVIQTEYAKRLGKFCVVNLREKKVIDVNNNLINITGKKVILRATYDNMLYGISILKKHDANLIENEEDIIKIEEWYNLKLTKRPFFVININNLVKGELDSELIYFLQKKKKVFLKSKKKGFNVIVKSLSLLQKDLVLMEFIKKKCRQFGEILLITEFLEIKKDSLGLKESRTIVLEGNIINSSRMIHSLKHYVPKSHLNKSQEIVEYIRKIKEYPQNYALDIGEFIEDGKVYFDIIEINPLSSSMCYVNNSIFQDELYEIRNVRKKMMMGYEYCYDALRNPDRYFEIRSSNINYSYISEESFYFS